MKAQQMRFLLCFLLKLFMGIFFLSRLIMIDWPCVVDCEPPNTSGRKSLQLMTVIMCYSSVGGRKKGRKLAVSDWFSSLISDVLLCIPKWWAWTHTSNSAVLVCAFTRWLKLNATSSTRSSWSRAPFWYTNLMSWQLVQQWVNVQKC